MKICSFLRRDVLPLVSLLLLSLESATAFSVVGPATHRVAPKPVATHCSSPSCSLLLKQSNDAVFPEDDDIEKGPVFQQPPPLIQETSRILRRVSFFSWWSQVILTTVSGVILTFARRITIAGTRDAAVLTAGPSFFLSGLGLMVSAVSILWTWGNGSRLSQRLVRRPVSRIQTAHMLRRAVRVGVTLNMVGLLVHLLAAEELVGSLAIRVMTANAGARSGAFMFNAMEGLQPLDVLVVQANTNALLSHFCSMASLLFLTKRIDKLDPPSEEENKRR